MTATKERIIITGPPRSGTTVVANYLNSLDRAFCFLEPHWEYQRVGTTRFFRDPKLRRFLFLKYRADEELPLDDAIRRIQGRYDIVGVKETFRGDHYASYDPVVPNEALLSAYVEAGYRLLPALRHPLSVWNSWLGFFVPEDAWPFDLQAFIENYRRFCTFAERADSVIYERFVDDPAREMRRLGISPEGFAGQLKRRKSKMGDPEAMRSSKISARQRPIRYTGEQRSVLEASGIVEAYESALERSRHAPETST